MMRRTSETMMVSARQVRAIQFSTLLIFFLCCCETNTLDGCGCCLITDSCDWFVWTLELLEALVTFDCAMQIKTTLVKIKLLNFISLLFFLLLKLSRNYVDKLLHARKKSSRCHHAASFFVTDSLLFLIIFLYNSLVMIKKYFSHILNWFYMWWCVFPSRLSWQSSKRFKREFFLQFL